MPKRTAHLIQVLKASGKREPFPEEKVRLSLRRAGRGRELAEDVLKIVESELYDGISTREIYRHIFQHLRETGTHLESKYNLKRALMELGPSGYPFEKFFAKVLESEGYQTAVGQQIRGKCVWHEVDVVAEKDSIRPVTAVKCHTESSVKPVVVFPPPFYARFLDVS